MANIRQLKEDNNQVFYPQTHEKAVIDSNGVTINTKIASKQDTISDLSAIRSGAAAGATAVQPAALDAKQDVISDLPTIRSGASLGSTSVQPVDIENMVEAEPIGSIIPPVNPSEFSTKEEVSQLRQEVTADVSQLEAEVHQLAGKFYGVFADDSDLPDDADAVGYAFVGATNPFAVWNFDGTNWSDSGTEVTGITGEPGVGFQSIYTPSPYDGTMIIVLSDGNTITVDLNHDHLAYPKYHLCADESEYTGITTKDSTTLYLIPES